MACAIGWLKTMGLGLVRAHALAEAPVASTQDTYPLLIFMPGNRTNAGLYSSLLEDLASHGYIVAAIDHPYDAGVVLLPDGRSALFAESRWPAPSAAPGPESSHARFYREQVDMRAADAAFVLERLAELQPGGADRLGGRLDLERAGVLVRGNANLIRRAVGNVLDNALKFTAAGGRVAVWLKQEADCARGLVSDSGIGISAADLPHVFGRFHRGRNAAQYPGSGLGLAIVQAIVDQHGGQVRVASSVGGTSVELSWPI